MTRPIALTNVRLIDPASRHDGPGAVLVRDGLIAEVIKGAAPAVSEDFQVIDGGGAMLAPGLVDIRVKTGEPGAETKETLKSVSRAAAAGGVTSIVVQPDTDPVIDDPAVVDFVMRRARDIGLVHVYPAGAATKGLGGERMAEIGLMRDAGCVYLTDVDHTLVNSKVFSRVMRYADSFGLAVAHRPVDPWLAKGAAATSGEFAGRMGLPSSPAIGERIMLERDLGLAELTGARLIVDQVTTASALESLARAKQRQVKVTATASINHLSFNELDIGDYRTFAKLDPPLRPESDRLALVTAIASGLVEIIVSAHAPAPAEEKRLPFDEAAPGSIGVETLLSGLITLHHENAIPLLDLLATVTVNPARLLGLRAGTLEVGAPADLVLCDIDAPVTIDADKLLSKSKNSAFDGRRLQGKVLMTLAGGRIVHQV